jgi:replicative DNA helicase
MTDKIDDNDRARAGTLPKDPSTGMVRVQPRPVARLDERRSGATGDTTVERALLGALLWCGSNAPDTLRVSAVADILESGEAFQAERHRRVFDACLACRASNVEHDPVAVFHELVKSGHDRTVGGMDVLLAIKDGAEGLSEPQARHYAERIRDTWARRKGVEECRALAAQFQSPNVATQDIISAAQGVVVKYAERSANVASSLSIKESMRMFFEDMNKGAAPPMATGLSPMDEALNGGLRPGEVSVLAARTNVGKSVLAAQWAEHIVSNDRNVGALYVTLEMGHRAFSARLLAARSGVPLNNLRRMVLNPTQLQEVAAAANKLGNTGLYFADSPSQTMAAIFATAQDRKRILARDGKRLGLVVVDHIGLVKPSAEALRRASREQQVAETSRALRFLASEIGCHVIGIAQIHRDAERQGQSSMPKLHHLRESGAIEMDADLVLILHRERDAKTGMFRPDKPACLAVAKGRLDETAIMLLQYEPHRARFSAWVGPETVESIYGAQ